ncbi:MAG: 1-acylglycerol-3-phosphate O-acyltransferase [Alphaproteobacteria bacterium]|nr:MAG: 1-acylglycerol-3-phosphate O-acyltransferase [Alphaproteobacteria bacterium]
MLRISRIIITIIWIVFSCTIGIIIGILRPFDPRNTKISANLIAWARHLLGVEIDLRNKEILDPARPCVFISNHQDNLDVIPGGYTLPKNTVTIGKRSLIFLPFFGQFFWLSGNILIDRKNKKRAFETMDVAANTIRDKKISVWIMPEGTRSKGRGLLPFKKGPFITAIKAQVPIVPIAISTYTKHLSFGRWNAGKMIVQVLPPISTICLTTEDAQTIKDQAFQLMKETIDKLDREIELQMKKNNE